MEHVEWTSLRSCSIAKDKTGSILSLESSISEQAGKLEVDGPEGVGGEGTPWEREDAGGGDDTELGGCG